MPNKYSLNHIHALPADPTNLDDFNDTCLKNIDSHIQRMGNAKVMLSSTTPVEMVSPMNFNPIERSSQKNPRFTCGNMPTSMISNQTPTGNIEKNMYLIIYFIKRKIQFQNKEIEKLFT